MPRDVGRPGGVGHRLRLAIPRPMQDKILVETAREHGADVREGWEFLDVLWRGGRVSGVPAKDPDGEIHELRAKLVIGADGASRPSRAGRRLASVPGVQERSRSRVPLRRRSPGRHALNETLSRWRDGDSFSMTFPSAPKPRMIALVMGPAARRRPRTQGPRRRVGRLPSTPPGSAKRLEDATNIEARSTADVPAYHRCPAVRMGARRRHRSLRGPGHRQRPRDAMWMGHTLATIVAAAARRPTSWTPACDARSRLATRVLSAYHFADSGIPIQPQFPVLVALAREAPRRRDPA